MMENTKQIIRNTLIFLVPLLIMGCSARTFSPDISGLPSTDTAVTTSADTVVDTQEEAESPTNQIIIHEAILAELENQANQNLMKGYFGLEEIKKIREICIKNNIEITFLGKRPTYGERKDAKLGEIDAIIRDTAYNEEATLY